jgi:hypothetical protein
LRAQESHATVTLIGLCAHSFPRYGRGGLCSFCLDTKSNKKIKSAERLLCALGLCPAKRVKPRAAILLPISRTAPRFSKSLLMPRQPHRPSVFPVSPEAYLLTLGDKTNILLIDESQINNKKEKKKEAQWPARVRGRESGLCGGSDQPGLIFWLLLDQAKSNKPFPRQLSGTILATRQETSFLSKNMQELLRRN